MVVRLCQGCWTSFIGGPQDPKWKTEEGERCELCGEVCEQPKEKLVIPNKEGSAAK